MRHVSQIHCTAFAGDKRIATGNLEHVALKVKTLLDADPEAAAILFDDATGHSVEVDFRGTPDDVLQRLEQTQDAGTAAPAEPRGPGRPKLGVVAREVTLLPRHWDWLGAQPGGASVALRKLVEEARRMNSGADIVWQSREASLRFMSVVAGNRPGFEEATRALFAGQHERFDQLTAAWPADIRNHARKLAAASFLPVADSAAKG